MEPELMVAIGVAVPAVLGVLKVVSKKTKNVTDDKIITLLDQIWKTSFGRKK